MVKKALGKGLGELLSSSEIDYTSSQNDADIKEISINEIHANIMQPRKSFDDDRLNELADSIKSKGLLQPILVYLKSANTYEIIVGERRWRAAKKAGLTSIPCIVKNSFESDSERLELALIENIQREDLNPIELANSYSELFNKMNITQEDLSKRLGKSRTSIANTMRLLKLPKDVQKDLVIGTISEGHGRALLSLKDDAKIIEFRDIIIDKKLSVRETEQIIHEELNPVEKPAVLLKEENSIEELAVEELSVVEEEIQIIPENNSQEKHKTISDHIDTHDDNYKNSYIDHELSHLFEGNIRITHDLNYKGKIEISVRNKEHFEQVYNMLQRCFT